MSESLIEKLERLAPDFKVVGEPLIKLCDVLAIIRQHEAERAAQSSQTSYFNTLRDVAKKAKHSDTLIDRALKAGLMCAEILVKEGGACGSEIYEEELPLIQRAIKESRERSEMLDNDLLRQAWELSTWAATINWRGGENHKEWLDDLRTKIEKFQTDFKSYKKSPKRELVLLEIDTPALAKAYVQSCIHGPDEEKYYRFLETYLNMLNFQNSVKSNIIEGESQL